MMIAVVSDIHANLAAFLAVLCDVWERPVDTIYSLGDCVGYNSSPHKTIALLRGQAIKAVKGNHDMMASGELPIERCGPHARASLQWTRTVLSEEERTYLRQLPLVRQVEPGILLCHSMPDDPVACLVHDQDYLSQYQWVRARYPSLRVVFTGHTHVPGRVTIRDGGVIRHPSASFAQLEPDAFHFINPGSVGHPRGSDYRARYALFDPATRQVRWIRVRYDKAFTRAQNQLHGIDTELGPGVVRYALSRWVARWGEGRP